MSSQGGIFLSVVVPVYGIDYELLRSCLDTLKGQDCERVEYIVVDDGSPDDCGRICDELAGHDRRFKVVHVENGGVSKARNIGIGLARGTYVMFVDADDGLYAGFIPGLIEFVEQDGSDVVFFGFTRSDKGGNDARCVGESMRPHSPLPSTFKLAKSIVEHTDTMLGLPAVMFGSPWGKVFRREFLDEHGCRFPLGIKKTQDRIFVVDVLSHNPSMAVYDFYGYVYVDRATSICRKYNPNIFKILDEAADCFSEVIERGFSGEQLEEMRLAENYLKVNYFFSSLPVSYFHPDNPRYGSEKDGFIELCESKSPYFKMCGITKMPIKQKKALLPLCKCGMYGTMYDLLTWYYGRNARP